MSNYALAWLLVAAATLWAYSTGHYISQVGKSREPIKATNAAWDTLIAAGTIAAVLVAAGRLF